jgi:hypothetical protein
MKKLSLIILGIFVLTLTTIALAPTPTLAAEITGTDISMRANGKVEKRS